MKKLTSVAALLLSSTLILSACGSSDDEVKPKAESSQATQSPEKSEDVKDDASDFVKAEGTGYSLSVPSDWDEKKDAQVDLYFSNEDGDRTMNTVLTPAINVTDDTAVKDIITRELKSVQFTNIEFLDKIDLGGEEAFAITSEFKDANQEVYIYQIFLTRGEYNYVMSVSAPSRSESNALAKEIVGSWKWS